MQLGTGLGEGNVKGRCTEPENTLSHVKLQEERAEHTEWRK